MASHLKNSVAVRDAMHYPLRIKNYDDLRAESLTSHLLVVALVPEDVADWLHQTEAQMVMRRCGYWMSLRNAPQVDNVNTITVKLPRAQTFTPEALKLIKREG
jgi:hypothetical protein